MVRVEREDEMIFLIPDEGRSYTIYTPGPSFAHIIEKALKLLPQKDLDYPFEEDER